MGSLSKLHETETEQLTLKKLEQKWAFEKV